MYWGELYLVLAIITVIAARLSPSMVARDCATVLIVWVAIISEVYQFGVSEEIQRVLMAVVALLVTAQIADMYPGSRLPPVLALGFTCMILWCGVASTMEVNAYTFKAVHNVIFTLQCIAALITAGTQWVRVRRLV